MIRKNAELLRLSPMGLVRTPGFKPGLQAGFGSSWPFGRKDVTGVLG